MIIQWDMDGVLANFNQGYRRLCNQMFDLSIDTHEQPEFWDDYPEGMDAKRDREVWTAIKKSEDFWYSLEPLVTLAERDRIASLNADQYFVTSRVGLSAKAQTEDWLMTHIFHGSPSYPTVIVSKRKSEAANALMANYVIDDKLGNVLQLYYNAPKNCLVYCRDARYNQLDPRLAGRDVIRVYSVTEFIDDIYRRTAAH